MRFSVIASGSKANCTYLEAAGTKILIDCGLSGREAAKRLNSIGVDPESLDAIIVTHEHRDHIHGVPILSRRFNLPVYANEGTATFMEKLYAIENFVSGECFDIGALKIRPFSVVHDAVDPVGFVIASEGLKFAQATDLGRVTPLVRDALALCNACVLESNYDQELLQICEYPWQLKQRISSTHGHLSNDDSGAFLSQIFHDELLHVVLAHLSENSNKPEFALETSSRYVDPQNFASIRCGSVLEATPLLDVGEPVKSAVA